MRIVVLVPWRSGERARERAWRYVAARWADMGWPLVAGGMGQAGPFSRAAAKNEAAANAGPWDAAVFVDADIFVAGREQITGAVEVALAEDRLVLPFEHYNPLTERETASLLADLPIALPSQRDPEPDPSVGGVVVVPRPLWERTGGFDERFVGWGFEDSAFHAAAGGSLRTPGEIWHLWHPPSVETNPRHPQHRSNKALAATYGVL